MRNVAFLGRAPQSQQIMSKGNEVLQHLKANAKRGELTARQELELLDELPSYGLLSDEALVDGIRAGRLLKMA